ncbi:D-2-hydroxyacid dehydrogenase [Pistricoccus aurantiacus]|uniref:D-2-hydroxyacid dehydrogenase n=1 Tax=Pistricoccus aurantiacus TaxID=1883414 RepID=UPI00362A12C2
MKAVLLDAATLGEDIDLAPLRACVDTFEVHASTRPEECIPRLQEAEIAIVNKVVLDAEVLESSPTVKLICLTATGTDNVDLEAAKRLGITVRNVEAYGTASVAQHTLMLMLALANRLPLYQRDVLAGRWSESPFFCLMDHRTLQLADKQLVIVGQGELGQAVATLAEAFSMRVSFAARPGGKGQDSRPTLVELAPQADVISLHCPLTQSTRHLIDADLLARLKPQALLINCARGGIVDEPAALGALQAGRLGGLGVDTLPQEPPPRDHPLLRALRDHQDAPLNLIVTPHNAWISPEARANVVRLTVDNIRSWQDADHAH